MIEISSEVFVVGPTRARSYSTIMYKAVHMTYEASPSRHSQGLFKTLRDHCKTNRGKADHQTSNPNLISCICRKDILRLLEFPLINSRNFLVMQSGVGDTGEAIYLTQTNNTYIQAVSIRQHITKKTPEIVYLNLRKASVIRVMAILPNSRPSTGWRRGYLTNNCIKEIFDVGKTQVFQNCNDKIVTTTPRSSTPRDTATTPK